MNGKQLAERFDNLERRVHIPVLALTQKLQRSRSSKEHVPMALVVNDVTLEKLNTDDLRLQLEVQILRLHWTQLSTVMIGCRGQMLQLW